MGFLLGMARVMAPASPQNLGTKAVDEAAVLVFGLKSCDSCRKALRELKAAGQTAELVDVRDPGLSQAQRDAVAAAFGDALINRKSKTWREIPELDRGLPPAELIARHPTVMKRPVIDAGGTLYLGWGPETKAALLGSG